MIPTSALPDDSRLTTTPYPSRTYKLDLKSGRIAGMAGGREAVAQMVNKVLHTERYAYFIYSGDYGMELEQYLGEDLPFVVADIRQTITEALEVDDRVLSVEDFRITPSGTDSLHVEFTVRTAEGDVTMKQEVAL